MNNFERRFGKFSITNLTIYIVIGRIAVMLFGLIDSSIYGHLVYDVQSIMSGEVWRLFTFMIVPNSSLIWFIFELLFLYWIGTNLENIWGSFKYGMYFLGSIAGIAVATLIIHFGNMMPIGITPEFLSQINQITTIHLSSLFTFALFFPFAWYNANHQILFMLFIPVKVKYLAIINLIFIALIFIDVRTRPFIWLVLGLSTINLLVFFACVITKRVTQKKRNLEFKHKVNKGEKAVAKRFIHKCAVCGITENDDPGMSFRYCSKCDGDYEYCEKHLDDHKHVTKIVPFNKDT